MGYVFSNTLLLFSFSVLKQKIWQITTILLKRKIQRRKMQFLFDFIHAILFLECSTARLNRIRRTSSVLVVTLWSGMEFYRRQVLPTPLIKFRADCQHFNTLSITIYFSSPYGMNPLTVGQCSTWCLALSK